MILAEWVRWGALAAGAAAAADLVALDVSRRKIPNAHLKLFAAAVLAGYLLLAFQAFSGAAALRFTRDFFLSGLLHAALCAAAGVGLWRLGVWPAGDAKLFILLGLWFPLADPATPLFPARLSLVFLMNAFIPAGVFVFAKTLWWLWLHHLRHGAGFLRELGLVRLPAYLRTAQSGLAERAGRAWGALSGWVRENPRAAAWRVGDGLLLALAGAAFTAWASRAAPDSWLKGPATALLFCVVWEGARRLLGPWGLRGLALLAAAAALRLEACGWAELRGLWGQWAFFVLFFDAAAAAVRALLGAGERFLTLFWTAFMLFGLFGQGLLFSLIGWHGGAALARWALWGAGLGLLYWLVASFLDEDVVTLRPEELHPYLLLAPRTLESLRSDEAFFEEHFERLYPDGLTPAQTEALKGWCSARGVGEVALRRTMPFALWIFIGGALTLWLRRDVVSLLLRGGPLG